MLADTDLWLHNFVSGAQQNVSVHIIAYIRFDLFMIHTGGR